MLECDAAIDQGGEKGRVKGVTEELELVTAMTSTKGSETVEGEKEGGVS